MVVGTYTTQKVKQLIGKAYGRGIESTRRPDWIIHQQDGRLDQHDIIPLGVIHQPVEEQCQLEIGCFDLIRTRVDEPAAQGPSWH